MKYTLEQTNEYQVDTGIKVTDLTKEQLQQEVCRLIDYLEEYAEAVDSLSRIENRWRSTVENTETSR